MPAKVTLIRRNGDVGLFVDRRSPFGNFNKFLIFGCLLYLQKLLY